ncbi:MAG: hypothetical protein DI566_11775 [Microbacterium sp.]|nr:MAG: hypothetical protein DI566_11775 [Microbacterium sp.]
MTTTIKVDDALRDRLKAQAARHGLTLGGHLAVLADAEDRRERLARLAAAIAATPDAVVAAHLDEAREWESTELRDVG